MKRRLAATILVIMVGLSILGLTRTTKILYDVPLVRQSTTYSCGAAALLAALEYYGIDDHNESEVMALVGTSPTKGTEIERMAKLAEQHHLRTEIRAGLSLDEIKAHIANEQLAVIELQAWPDSDVPSPPYPEVWTDGHYAIAIGVDEEKIYFMDPSLLGSRGFIPAKEFLDRWHEISTKGEKVQHSALLLHGTPKPPAAWSPIP